MRTRTTLAFGFAIVVAAGLATAPARAQDTEAAGAGGAATRSPSTSPIDAPPATNRGVIGNEVPGRRVVPRTAVAPGTVITPGGAVVVPGPGAVLPGGPGMMAGRPGGAFVIAPNATFDQLFAAAAASSGIAEVTMARLAAQRGSSDEVKLFAQRMVTDHTKANNELVALATSRAIGVPMAMEVRDRADEAILAGLAGDDFDKAYIHQQLAAHMCAVALFKAEAERGRDPQLRAWAARMLPTLEDHKTQAKRMHDDFEARHKKAATSQR